MYVIGNIICFMLGILLTAVMIRILLNGNKVTINLMSSVLRIRYGHFPFCKVISFPFKKLSVSIYKSNEDIGSVPEVKKDEYLLSLNCVDCKESEIRLAYSDNRKLLEYPYTTLSCIASVGIGHFLVLN